ncbi:ATP-binding protein [Amphibacillus sp. Q70]|uniref:hybrid sensor histidine kinase/response regulator n=1 Tax=Amphibacillus sp. Q70 TaxID=3453416 RepID=UPI003F8284CD
MKRNYVWLGTILLLFIIGLSSSRFIWATLSGNSLQLDIQEGELDLRERNLDEKETLVLNGEWDFYPSTFIMEDDNQSNVVPETIVLPDGWNDLLGSSTGYGSYHLKIKVNPDQDKDYSLYVPSIRDSSEIYVNGRQLSGSGEVATTEEQFTAKNVPQTTVFTANEDGIIDLVIQAANYKDLRDWDSGIVRSIRFGTEQAVTREVQFSIYMQISMVIILLLHSVYTLILYFIGNRNKHLFYFSLLTFVFAIIFLFTSKEKLFHQLFYIDSDLTMRLLFALCLIAGYALLQCTDHRELPYWKRIFPYYQGSVFGLAFITLFLTISQTISLLPVYILIGSSPAIVSLFAVARAYRQSTKTDLFLVLSFVAAIHHVIWAIAWRENGMYLPHYPFDLIIALICLVIVWFKEYFHMHEETKELAESLQRMNQEKDQFLANTSHEFRNPLNSILLLSKAVRDREETALSERSINELNTVLDVGKKMNLLLTDLLEARQLQNSKPRLDKQVITLEPIVTGVIDLLKFSSDMKQLQIINQISKEFPAVYADENRLTQILFNLVKNAIKYTDHGLIVISATVKEKIAEIHVTDTGTGISAEMKKRVFLPYEQGDSSEAILEGGFGLGLSITKQLVELHGGTIRVSSKEGEKTTFTFTLALASPHAAVQLPSEKSQATRDVREAGQTEGSSLKNSQFPSILVVDDNPVSLLALNATLPADEYNAIFVSNASQALEELKKEEWDMIISDIMMPEISGYQLTRNIRERYSLTELPILLLTGGNSDIQAAFEAGANDYVTKPVEPIELKARMDSLITLKRVAQQQLQLETSWLQAQIQPHFLFNTLNSIKALSEWDIEEMRQLLDQFGNFLRSKFQFHQMKALIPLEEELNIVRSYLYIEQVRFGDALEVKWELEEDQDVNIPFLSIQPLVENAVLHGIRQRQGKGTVMIKFVKDSSASKATFTIEDDGVGIDEAEIPNLLNGQIGSQSGVGLLNVEQRLHQHYGKGLTIVSSPGQGTRVSFEVDLSKN